MWYEMTFVAAKSTPLYSVPHSPRCTTHMLCFIPRIPFRWGAYALNKHLTFNPSINGLDYERLVKQQIGSEWNNLRPQGPEGIKVQKRENRIWLILGRKDLQLVTTLDLCGLMHVITTHYVP